MKAYLSIGTNQGERQENLRRSIACLESTPGIRIVKVSETYETEPWGMTDQEQFLNLVCEIDTDLEPHRLLQKCQEIEHSLGRKRFIHWGPRIIDIDILLYGDLIIETDELIIPHPYMEKREFVLAPLREIAPELVLPPGLAVKNIKGEGMVKKKLFK